MTEPGYDPGRRPVWNRSPGGWPPSCGHPRSERRKATITTYENKDEAEAWYMGRARGWCSTDGWLFEGAMPPEGERFRIMPIGGSLDSHFEHSSPYEIPFPTIDMAREYAEEYHEYPDGNQDKQTLYNIVGDRDTVVRWSSYTLAIGTELTPGDWA
ncbi:MULTISPECIES: hypothetical protein [Streptomyces]|uniref:hypothetical protein n=1 Tax=Streptomyces TaxID=1883 RepID=UPI00131B1470|nr:MULTISPECIES: hypothetical protein [Streptomyces]